MTSTQQSMRASFYADDGHNHPPPSPTAKWKHTVYARVCPPEDPNKHPYLPHPFPVKRVRRARDGHQGGFTSLQESARPRRDPNQEEVYCTYPEWWWAQRPPFGKPPDADVKAFSTSYWPYGHRMSAIASVDDKGEFYDLDDRRIKNHMHVKQHQREQSKFQSYIPRTQSAAELMCSRTEHFHFDKSMAGLGASSHVGASFHEKKKLASLTSPLGRTDGAAGKPRTMWDLKAQANEGSALRSPSAPSTMRSVEALAGSSKYDPKQSHRDMGLASRTHAEFRLPQHPVRASTPWT